MSAFTDQQANEFKLKASDEKYFAKFVHYNSYLEVTYIVPQNKFLGFKVPQWSMIKSMVLFEDNFIITLALFNDNYFM
jgi:hypothetical protein